jgi:16S rRNA (uracil1498-N3)-methyltransferase
VRLDPTESAHATRVLRLGAGAPVVVTDGAGRVADCTLLAADARAARAGVIRVRTASSPRPEIVVYQGAAKGRKVDDVVQRLAEVGVARIGVFGSRRAVVNWDRAKAAALEARWAAIARSVAKQSRSAFAAATAAPLSWDDLVRAIEREPCALALWENASKPLRALVEDLERVERVALVVGPEGGFEEGEAGALERAGAHLASLGERVLRTENAALVAASALLWHFGRVG